MDYQEERIGELLKQINRLRRRNEVAITEWEYYSSNERILLQNYKTKQMKIKSNDFWGREGKYYLFHTTYTIPKEQEDKKLTLYLVTGREAFWDATNPQMLCIIDGVILQGLDMNHQECFLAKSYQEGEKIDITLIAYVGEDNAVLTLNASIRELVPMVETFYYDLLIPWQIVCLEEKDQKQYHSLIGLLTDCVNCLDLRQPYSEAFYDGVKKASGLLKTRLYDVGNETHQALVYCIGHTHIDIGWLWTTEVTKDKAIRSFATVIALMERYKEYKFMSSQPQLYQYVKEGAPILYEKIKKFIIEGRWEAEGGMWVECDCNIPSGESLVRQFLYGKRFFFHEFNYHCKILWLPDVFGYSAALPQIMKKSGIDYFMTTKISWNETNQMPYDSFYWEGIDGTKVLSHFICTRDYQSVSRHPITTTEYTTAFSTNYNGYPHPSQVKGAWQRYQQKELNEEILLSYGYGDGGGGTTDWMIESVKRMNVGLPGVPKTCSATALSFFHDLENKLRDNPKTPLWSGELYLENHRGTYTSMGIIKRWNRKMEFLITDTEFMSVMTDHWENKMLDNCWIMILRNQFHDILPGSSIAEVYQDTIREYNEINQKLKPYCEQLCEECVEMVKGAFGDLIVFNFNGTQCRTSLLSLSKKQAEFLPCNVLLQETEEETVIIRAKELPAKGYFNLNSHQDHLIYSVPSMLRFDEEVIETVSYRINLNEKGQFISYYDKEADRELIQKGCAGNVLMTYEDKPHSCDNWNLYSYYKEKCWEVSNLTSIKKIEEGPLRYTLELKYSYLSSEIIERISCYPDQKSIDLSFSINWKENQIFLKLLFPVQISTKEATFEIQYGNVKRNMIKNTSWDCARFEVCYQKWLDLTEADSYGISIINNCKYGVSIDENVIGLSLLKSGLYPNPDADKGFHQMAFSVFLHSKDFRHAGTVSYAYEFNHPCRIVSKSDTTLQGKDWYQLIEKLPENVIVEAVKKAEDGNGTIVRMYEAYGRRTKVNFFIHRVHTEVFLTNLMEKKERKILNDGDGYSLVFLPYEILTIQIV